jgi:hypothetical protein
MMDNGTGADVRGCIFELDAVIVYAKQGAMAHGAPVAAGGDAVAGKEYGPHEPPLAGLKACR